MQLTIFGRTFELRTKAIPLRPISDNGWGWWPIVRESFSGAWQQNVEVTAGTALAYYAVYACERLIATDCGKLCWRLVEEVSPDVWQPTTSSAFSPLLRKPNHYQTWGKLIEQWMLSKLNRGNAYALKEYDGRSIVRALYVLDPSRVTVLVAPDGSVWYQCYRDDLAGITDRRIQSTGLRQDSITFPASEIIHDPMLTPFHPLLGIGPLYAAAWPTKQGLAIQAHSTTFFENRVTPDGILTTPMGITQTQADAYKAAWKARKPGDVAVLAGELKYQQLSHTAVESQLIEQEELTAQQVCSAYGVPPYLVDIGDPPPYANFEPLLLKYHSQCIQSLLKSAEDHLDEGLGLTTPIDGRQLGIEADVDDLIWMDTATRVSSAKDAIGSGGMTPNEARLKYFALGAVSGGDKIFLQQQYWPAEELINRQPAAEPARPQATPPIPETTADETDAEQLAASFGPLLKTKFIEHGLYASD